MNRRQFLETVAAGLAAAAALASQPIAKLPQPPLGRTGLKVPILGFGSGSRFQMYKDEDKAMAALNHAIDLGITYIDTAHSYGDGHSEERVGRVMATRGKEVTLSTKLAGRTADQARRQIELSLKRLQTDHLDVLHIHELKSLKDLAAIEAPGGVLEALYQAREQKVAHAIGITCHADPVALQTALERHDFDCTQMALNAGLARMADVPGGFKATLMGAGSFERLALPVATRKKMGVIAMKVFGQEQLLGAAPADKLLTYALPMNLQNTTFVTPCTAARCKEWLFLTTSLGSGAQSASKCRGILSLPISLASVGMPRLEHIESNAALARAFKPMSTRQRQQLEESIESSRKLAMQHFFADHQDV